MLIWIAGFIMTAAATEACLPFGELGTSEQSGFSVSQYSSEFESCSYDGRPVYSLRKFNLNGTVTRLTVDPNSLQTDLVADSCLQSCSGVSPVEFDNSFYGSILNTAGSAPFSLQNDGLKQGLSSSGAVSVTIDMCPSSKGISQEVYDQLVEVAQDENSAFPVGIAMTRKWLTRYPQHFAWLKEQQLEGRFQILWINHSATHPYKESMPLAQNFLLSAGVDFDDEVLGTEQALIGAGVTPSVFFRFPGLVSSESQIRQLGDWGLIALGSQAWLAKGESPVAGSIILIHGNRNEPAGEKLFLDYVQKKSSDIAWGSLLDVLGIN